MMVTQIDGTVAAMPDMESKPNRSNLRTGLILGVIALVFFLSVIVKRLALG
jgi:hypothetical protein